MESMYEYPYSTVDGPDPGDMTPELEEPRCHYCGHEITTAPVIRLFDDHDHDAQWNICEPCLSKSVVPMERINDL